MKEFLKKIGRAFSAMGEKAKLFLKSTASFKPPAKEKVVNFVVHWWHWLLGGIFAFLILYYPVGALLTHKIDVSFPELPIPTEQNENAAPKTLTTLTYLIDREVNKHVFTPNLPFIFPSSVLDNMPSFQTGVIHAITDIVENLRVLNPDSAELKQAAEYLNYPSTVWYIKEWKPASASHKKYQLARFSLMQYEKAIEKGKQKFDTSPRALLTLISTLADGLKEVSLSLETQVSSYEDKIIDFNGDDVFYYAKGQAFVYASVLRSLSIDFPSYFEDKNMADLQYDALTYLKNALAIQPLFVVNASPETQFAPNHLLILGFYVSRAQSDLLEMFYVMSLSL